MLTLERYLTSDGKHPSLAKEIYERKDADQLLKNAALTHSRASEILSRAGIDDREVNSGWRTEGINRAVGGSPKSKHLRCLAIDLSDNDECLGKWCLANLETLKELGMAMESLDVTHKTEGEKWVHLQIGAPHSGHLVFLP